MTIPLSRVPAMKAKKMRALLRSLGYVPERDANGGTRGHGSHVILVCQGRGRIVFGFHDKATVSCRAVRKILLVDAGLTEDEFKEVLGL